MCTIDKPKILKRKKQILSHVLHSVYWIRLCDCRMKRRKKNVANNKTKTEYKELCRVILRCYCLRHSPNTPSIILPRCARYSKRVPFIVNVILGAECKNSRAMPCRANCVWKTVENLWTENRYEMFALFVGKSTHIFRFGNISIQYVRITT